MTDDDTEVKGIRRRFAEWVDCHPRTGWYIAALLVLNTILNILDLFVK